MEMALYYPGLGYYTKESTTIGRAGDFYTSPHLHPIFGAMIARQVEEMWLQIGRPDNFQIVEMGAGVGYLAKDLLGHLDGKEICNVLNYTILELNHHVKARQRTLLREHLDKIRWVTDLKELDHFSGCLISNELLDAFPVRLVEMEDELKEIYLAVREDAFVEVRKPCSKEVRDYFMALDIHLPADFRTEVNLRIKDWLTEVSQRLSEGFVITIDFSFDRLRYALFPYIYSLAGWTTQSGYTMMRPLVMDFPADRTARELPDEYMFGPALLV
ncbi:MAG: SAM-dependent methyltransferase, partial [Dissulfurispiraceae bacterium]